MKKSPLVAFLLSFIPGLGHLYIGRFVRAFFYFISSFGIMALYIVFSMSSNHFDGEAFIVAFIVATFIFLINMLDMIVTITNGRNSAFVDLPKYQNINGQMVMVEEDPLLKQQYDERIRVIMMSLIPGLGHLYMNLMKRGMSFFTLAIGIFALGIIATQLFHSSVYLIVWLALPIVGIYCIFDALRIVKVKQLDEMTEDISIFDSLQSKVQLSESNKALAIILSVIPGLGHLYLGYAKQGIQLLSIFVGSMFIANQMNLSVMVYVLPLICCYSLFDVLYIIRKEQSKEHQDSLAQLLAPYKRWIGVGFTAFGLYYLIDIVASKALRKYNIEWLHYYNELRYMIPTVAIAFIVILVGIKLISSSVKRVDKASKK